MDVAVPANVACGGRDADWTIIVYLDTKERSVSDIEASLKIRQPTLSQQLGELRDAGLIVGRRVSKSAVFASVIPTRKTEPVDWRIGFKSLLQE